MPALEALADYRKPDSAVRADAGYHSEAGLKRLAEQAIEAYICDNDYRRRDPRFEDQAHHKAKGDALYNRCARTERVRLYRPQDFQLAADRSDCLCPAGKRLYANGKHCTFNGFAAMKFCGAKQDCVPCKLRARCLRFPDRTKVRQVAFFQGRRSPSHSDRMKERIDSPTGRRMIARRFATVEPVFANLRHNKGLNRFTLRGRRKSMHNGSCTAWCTTSRNWRIMAMRSEKGQDNASNASEMDVPKRLNAAPNEGTDD